MVWMPIAILALTAAIPACAPRAEEGGFDSPNPAAKLYAIHDAGQARDADAVPHLIEQLNSDDPAVRMYAINALERITGRRMDYSPYAPPHQRRQAIQRWVQAWESGRLQQSLQAGRQP